MLRRPTTLLAGFLLIAAGLLSGPPAAGATLTAGSDAPICDATNWLTYSPPKTFIWSKYSPWFFGNGQTSIQYYSGGGQYVYKINSNCSKSTGWIAGASKWRTKTCDQYGCVTNSWKSYTHNYCPNWRSYINKIVGYNWYSSHCDTWVP
jgi:hypothetical protein